MVCFSTLRHGQMARRSLRSVLSLLAIRSIITSTFPVKQVKLRFCTTQGLEADAFTGTYWYHSHLATQYCDGLRGPLIIYDPADPQKHLYDIDDGESLSFINLQSQQILMKLPRIRFDCSHSCGLVPYIGEARTSRHSTVSNPKTCQSSSADIDNNVSESLTQL